LRLHALPIRPDIRAVLAASLAAEPRLVSGKDVDWAVSLEFVESIQNCENSANGGLIVTTTPRTLIHRDLIVALAARHRLPAVYSSRPFVAHGGLVAYGPDILDQFRRSAAYVDRILKGEKPADLPVQAPTKYELLINLKTAKALGLELPAELVARADEVIE
jgi:putative ABC transport system substrate-binding protein